MTNINDIIMRDDIDNLKSCLNQFNHIEEEQLMNYVDLSIKNLSRKCFFLLTNRLLESSLHEIRKRLIYSLIDGKDELIPLMLRDVENYRHTFEDLLLKDITEKCLINKSSNEIIRWLDSRLLFNDTYALAFCMENNDFETFKRTQDFMRPYGDCTMLLLKTYKTIDIDFLKYLHKWFWEVFRWDYLLKFLTENDKESFELIAWLKSKE